MSYAQAVESLYARGHELAHAAGATAHTPPRKFDLAEMRVLMAALGQPEAKFPSILIAGTNGKGSTSAMLASILGAAGYRAGLYTSPHLSRVNERIQINGTAISDDDFARLYFRVDETGARLLRESKLPQHPSFFETMTAVAFLYFAEQAVDLAVLEVGMGGRLDATNIVEPLICVITDISLDHTEWLGNTIDAIAREKAGILRKNGVLVTLPQHPVANQAIGEIAVALGVKGVNAAEYMPPYHATEQDAAGPYSVTIAGESVELSPALAGTHQHRNAALAVAAACALCNNNSYNIEARHVAEGIRTTCWPGRLELFPPTVSTGTDAHPAILLDVAHNPAGAWTLRSALNTWPALATQNGPRTLLFGCLKEKAIHEMAQILFPVFDHVVLTPVHSPRTAVPEDLEAAARSLGIEPKSVASPAAGLDLAQQQIPADGLIVCAGSVYLIGELRDILLNQQGKG